jgi:hypothetical protein
MLKSILEVLGPWGPLLFGLGFIAPVIAALLERAGIYTVGGAPVIAVGLVIGAATGFWASRRRSWL